MNNKTIEWVCTNCEINNVDILGETAVPICEQCGEPFEWNDILAGFIETTEDAQNTPVY